MKFDKYHFSLLIVCLIQAGVILAGVVLWVLPQKESAQAQKPPPPLTTADTRTLDGELERAQKLVSARLKDPYSARFSDLVHKTVRTARGEPFDVVCGQVNARNSYGGYGGEKLFVYFVDSGQVALGEGKVSYTNVDPLIA